MADRETHPACAGRARPKPKKAAGRAQSHKPHRGTARTPSPRKGLQLGGMPSAADPAADRAAAEARSGVAARRAASKRQRRQEVEARRLRQLAAVDALNEGFALGFDLGRLPRSVEGDVELRFVVSRGSRTPTGATATAGSARPRRSICYVDPGRVEQAFQRSSLYVGRHGANPRGSDALADSRRRYRAALEFFASGRDVMVSVATLEGPTLSQVRFVDGKHRFCAYRDLGMPCIPLLVPASQRRRVMRLFRAKRPHRLRCKQLLSRRSRASFDTPRSGRVGSCGGRRQGHAAGTVPGADEALLDDLASEEGPLCEEGPLYEEGDGTESEPEPAFECPS